MLEIFTSIIIQALSKIFEKSADMVAGDISWRRSIAAACIKLYDSLEKLESDSRAAYESFKAMAEGTRTPTKVMIKDRMDALFKSSESFIKNLREVESKLNIYDQDLLIKIRDIRSMKFGTLVAVDMLLDAAPSHIKEGKKLTSLISYPTSISDLSAQYVQTYPSGSLYIKEISNEWIENEVKKIRKSIKAKLKKKTVDLALPAEAKIALRGAEDNIRTIEQTRKQLAEFIKQNFPLNEILG
jgi:hypothetical protein